MLKFHHTSLEDSSKMFHLPYFLYATIKDKYWLVYFGGEGENLQLHQQKAHERRPTTLKIAKLFVILLGFETTFSLLELYLTNISSCKNMFWAAFTNSLFSLKGIFLPLALLSSSCHDHVKRVYAKTAEVIEFLRN